jgi:nicotinamide riboside transporter PnuC
MEGKSTAKLYYLFAIICGTWFLVTSWIWVYFANLMFSYPVALLGLFLWSRGKKLNPGSKANPISLWLHIAGFVVSVIALIILLFNN